MGKEVVWLDGMEEIYQEYGGMIHSFLMRMCHIKIWRMN